MNGVWDALKCRKSIAIPFLFSYNIVKLHKMEEKDEIKIDRV